MSAYAMPSDEVKRSFKPDPQAMRFLGQLVEIYRKDVDACLSNLVSTHYPLLLEGNDIEYRKMVELSTKMTIVGRACAEVAGVTFDSRLQTISCLFGGCCFLADSFIDDFGEEATMEYLDRFDLLLTKGWFDVRNEREQLFYITISRLFSERDIFTPMLRQAILWLYHAQKADCMFRFNYSSLEHESRRVRLRRLKEYARNRSGHAITLLAHLLVPELTLELHQPLFTSGALIMHIDDHGDSHSDRSHNRFTFMNQVKRPAQVLSVIFNSSMKEIYEKLPDNAGRQLLTTFLYRYYTTRLEKHRIEKQKSGFSWHIYE